MGMLPQSDAQYKRGAGLAVSLSGFRIDGVIPAVAPLDRSKLVGKRRHLLRMRRCDSGQHPDPGDVVGAGLRIGGLDVPATPDAIGHIV